MQDVLLDEMQARNIKSYWDLTEFDCNWVYRATMANLNNYREKHGQAWLGKINRYDEDKGKPYLVEYTGQKIYTFDYGVAVPCNDQKLIELIKTRETSPLKDNMKTADDCFNRVEELGGITLIWQ